MPQFRKHHASRRQTHYVLESATASCVLCRAGHAGAAATFQRGLQRGEELPEVQLLQRRQHVSLAQRLPRGILACVIRRRCDVRDENLGTL